MPALAEVVELMARASSTSEVLTLNLTNLLILIVLKALIFGFGLFSVGTARSSDQQGLVSEAEIEGGSCVLMYLGNVEEKLSCIKRVACRDPVTANGYKTAAKMLVKAGKYLNYDMSARHENVLNAITDGANHAASGGDCAVFDY